MIAIYSLIIILLSFIALFKQIGNVYIRKYYWGLGYLCIPFLYINSGQIKILFAAVVILSILTFLYCKIIRTLTLLLSRERKSPCQDLRQKSMFGAEIQMWKAATMDVWNGRYSLSRHCFLN